MAEYISKEDLNRYFDTCIAETGNTYAAALVLAIQKDLNNKPVADFLDKNVVKCKDCRYWKTEYSKANGYHCCYRIHNAFPMREDDFCSKGRRANDGRPD